MHLQLLVMVMGALSAEVSGYRVLVMFPTPSRSHGALARGIVSPLLQAGHQVTWVSPYTDWKPHQNLTLIDTSASLDIVKDIDMTQRAAEGIAFVKEFALNVSTQTYSTRALQKTLVEDQYDAVVTEWFFSDYDAGIAAVQRVPWILVSGTVIHPHLEDLVDEVRSISTIPMFTHDFPVPMSFGQRVVNTVSYVLMWCMTRLDLPSTAARYEELFAPIAAARGVTLPPFYDALYNVSILLVNSHQSMSTALSLPPNVVNIGGYHIEEGQPLPKDIQHLLDSSPEGVVYFSMGSVLKSSILPVTLRQDLISIFAELPYKVLWKFEENLSGLPKNIVVRKWWPQAGVLAHPNVKLFITHGGLLSTTEAVHYGVPLLAIPVFGDQPSNAARAVKNGYALTVPYSEDMGSQLRVALQEMLNNDSYYKQAKYLSKLFNSRPVHPSKLITHYIELAIESKGAYHLRAKSYLYAWYQRWMIDQLMALLALLYGLYIALRALCRRRHTEKKVKKN